MDGFWKFGAIAGLLSSVITVVSFVTGWSSLHDVFQEGPIVVENGELPPSATDDHDGEAVPAVQGQDNPLLTGLKAIAVFYVMFFGVIATIFAFVIDSVGQYLNYEMSLTSYVWEIVWNKITLSWYWERSTDLGLVLSAVFFVAFSAIVNFIEDYY